MSRCIEESKIYQKIDNDPLTGLNCHLQFELDTLLEDKLITANEHRSLLPTKGQPVPHIFAQIKTHKSGHPLRLITSAKGNPAQPADWMLTQRLRKYIWGKRMIKNSDEFVMQLKNHTLKTGQQFFSLDVISLFPSIPHRLIMECFLESAKRLDIPENEVDKDRRLLRLILSGIYVRFLEQGYKQREGTPMGYSCSPILAELVLQFFDEFILQQHPSIEFYCRYVDDVGAIASPVEATHVLQTANKWHPDLQFTIEFENEMKQIPFLDILLTRRERDFIYAPYQKPMATDRGLLFSSAHPRSQLRAIATNEFRRTILHSSSPTIAYSHIQKTKGVFLKRGYPGHLLERCIQQAKKSIKTSTDPDLTKDDNPFPQFHAITYLEGCSDSISNILRKHGIVCHYKLDRNLKKSLQSRRTQDTDTVESSPRPNPVNDDPPPSDPENDNTMQAHEVSLTSTCNTTRQHPYNTRSRASQMLNHKPDETDTPIQVEPLPSPDPDPPPRTLVSQFSPQTRYAVYQVPCGDCPARYVGETKRRVEARLQEHVNAARNRDVTNGIGAHVQDTGHNINWSRASILLKSNSRSKPHLRTLESLAIKLQQSTGTPLMNIQPPTNPNAIQLVHPSLSSRVLQKWSESSSYNKDQSCKRSTENAASLKNENDSDVNNKLEQDSSSLKKKCEL